MMNKILMIAFAVFILSCGKHGQENTNLFLQVSRELDEFNNIHEVSHDGDRISFIWVSALGYECEGALWFDSIGPLEPYKNHPEMRLWVYKYDEDIGRVIKGVFFDSEDLGISSVNLFVSQIDSVAVMTFTLRTSRIQEVDRQNAFFEEVVNLSLKVSKVLDLVMETGMFETEALDQ